MKTFTFSVPSSTVEVTSSLRDSVTKLRSAALRMRASVIAAQYKLGRAIADHAAKRGA